MAKISRDEVEAKQKIRNELAKANQALRQHPRRRNQFQTSDNELVVYVVFSRLDQLWYGIPEKYIEEWQSQFRRGFVLFAAGSGECVYVVPLDRLVEALQSDRRTPVGNRGFELHLLDDQSVFREIPTLYLDRFRNAYLSLRAPSNAIRESASALAPVYTQKTPDNDVSWRDGEKQTVDLQQPLESNSSVTLQRSPCIVVIEPGVYRRVEAEAHRRSIAVETLVNLWLLEKLREVERGSD